MVWDVVERGSMLRLKVSQKTALGSNDALLSLGSNVTWHGELTEVAKLA